MEGKEKVGKSTGPQLWVGDRGGDRLRGRADLREDETAAVLWRFCLKLVE